MWNRVMYRSTCIVEHSNNNTMLICNRKRAVGIRFEDECDLPAFLASNHNSLFKLWRQCEL